MVSPVRLSKQAYRRTSVHSNGNRCDEDTSEDSKSDSERSQEMMGGVQSWATNDPEFKETVTEEARTIALRQVEEELTRLRLGKKKRRPIRAICASICSTLPKCFGSLVSKNWIRSNSANYCFGFVILINSVYIGFETDCNRPRSSLQLSKRFWLTSESVFLSIFIVELLLRFRSDGLHTLKDAWGVFDLMIIIVGVFDTWVMPLIVPDDRSIDEDLQTLSLLRLGRLIRIARVLRIVRLLRFVRELLLLVRGMFGALKALIWAFLLITMVLYISGIFVTEIIRGEIETAEKADVENLKMWFGSVGTSILTLAQLMTLEGWPLIVRFTSLEGDRLWLLCFFLPFICCTNFALLNVVTAIMVENVFAYAEEEKTAEVKKSHRNRRQAIERACRLFTAIDVDKSDTLTAEEVKKALHDPVVLKQFQESGVAKHDIDTLFQCLDVTGNGQLSVGEFCEGCLRMHGDATAQDLLRVQYDVHRARKRVDIKRLIRHITLSAWCLQNDYENSLARTKPMSQSRDRKRGRAQTFTPATDKQQNLQSISDIMARANKKRASRLDSQQSAVARRVGAGSADCSSLEEESEVPKRSKLRRSNTAPPKMFDDLLGTEVRTPRCASPCDANEVLLPAASTVLLHEVVEEQKHIRHLLLQLGEEARTLRCKSERFQSKASSSVLGASGIQSTRPSTPIHPNPTSANVWGSSGTQSTRPSMPIHPNPTSAKNKLKRSNSMPVPEVPKEKLVRSKTVEWQKQSLDNNTESDYIE